MYLLDTVTISETFKRHQNLGVLQWYCDTEEREMFISVISIGEIQRGIARQKKINYEYACRLEDWFAEILDTYKYRMLSVSQSIAILWGDISMKVGNSGTDNLIAATALYYRMTVVTRNVRHFEPTGVRCYNPWVDV